MRIKDRLYRLPPCPPYDVEATESWLEDMAAQGWMLEKNNIFLGVAAFEKAEPPPSATGWRLPPAASGTSTTTAARRTRRRRK